MTPRQERRAARLRAFVTGMRHVLADYERLAKRYQEQHDLSGWETLQLLQARSPQHRGPSRDNESHR